MVLNGDVRLFDPELPVIQANSADPDKTPRSVASDLGLHCVPMSQSTLFPLHSDVTATRISVTINNRYRGFHQTRGQR